MALFKCKMCGGTLEINNKESVATCEYCGTQQTIPKLEDDRRANLFDRANHFRRNNEFDKAVTIYEQILNEDNTDAEIYWSLVLCRYGIEYVEDPSTHKRIPTVNRAQFTSIFDDDNYKSALNYADGYQRSLYEEEAKAINEIQKGILAISQKEEPFDVFICYKETDANGRRTQDSVLAQDLYFQLKQEGFKVFFSRITLEDKLGSAYEPYIFAALNSAKVMVVLGTKAEYFNAVWVKNEWSRYLALIKGGAKKMLIPAYKDMDPYELPEEFSHLQAQDMSKLGFMQDLVRGIRKIIKPETPKAAPAAAAFAAPAGQNVAPLLKRASMFLEDGDWNSANSYCERVLDIAPENADAYVIKLMAHVRVSQEADLAQSGVPLDTLVPYRNAIRFADEATVKRLNGYNDEIKARLYRLEQERLERLRLAQEQKEREERYAQRARELNQQRNEAINTFNQRRNQLTRHERAIADKEKELGKFPNMIAVRIMAVISALLAFITVVSFISFISKVYDYDYNYAYEDPTAAMMTWLLFSLIYFISTGILAKVCKRSFGWMFLNIPTAGIAGFIFALVMFIKSFVSQRGKLVKLIQSMKDQTPQIHQSIQMAQRDIQMIDRAIAEHQEMDPDTYAAMTIQQ